LGRPVRGQAVLPEGLVVATFPTSAQQARDQAVRVRGHSKRLREQLARGRAGRGGRGAVRGDPRRDGGARGTPYQRFRAGGTGAPVRRGGTGDGVGPTAGASRRPRWPGRRFAGSARPRLPGGRYLRLVEGGTTPHDRWNRQVVQRQQGLRLHRPGRGQRRLRARQCHPRTLTSRSTKARWSSSTSWRAGRARRPPTYGPCRPSSDPCEAPALTPGRRG
jgi:hypothetical protein